MWKVSGVASSVTQRFFHKPSGPLHYDGHNIIPLGFSILLFYIISTLWLHMTCMHERLKEVGNTTSYTIKYFS